MLQLVKKDFVIHKIILLGMLAGLIIYMVLDVSAIFLGLLFSFTMTLQIFSSDEKRTAQILLSSLPLTRREIVSSKYIAAFLYIAIIICILIAGSFIVHQEQPNWIHLGLVAVASLVVVAFMYPFSYKFASKYLLITFVIGFAVYFLAMKLFIHDLNDQFRAIILKVTPLMESQAMFFALIAALVLYGVSWILSVKIYEQKVF
ncbi:ABC-2 transporter permease [Solibacillus cecembensis]|uniref:ABC-2 transporter permease n=1 Tax=Solibacillus cecembensis TaxID=459347 RepID=UPI003D030C7B